MSVLPRATDDAKAPMADMETTLMTEAMYGLYLMSRDTDLPPTVVAKLLDPKPPLLDTNPPPGLTKQTSLVSNVSPSSTVLAPQSETDTVSTTSNSGDGASEHEVGSDPDWQGYDGAEEHLYQGMPLDPFATDPYANCWQSLTTPLSEDLFGLLSSRRGKQRLRALQTQSGAHAELDLNWRLLHLCGPRLAVLNALAQLELMEGFTVKVPPALWTELLRCRNLGVEQAPMSLERIQELLGRRVHVERETLALRVFAPLAERLATTQAVQELASLCTKQTIDLPADCDWNIIKELQMSAKVTMKVEGNRVELIGLTAAVEQAAEDLNAQLYGGVDGQEEAKPTLLGAKLNKAPARRLSLVRPPPGLEQLEAKPLQNGFKIQGLKEQVCYVSHDNCTELCFR